MFDARSAFTNGLEMLDGAVCHFMGSDVATITQRDEFGRPQSATLSAATMRRALEDEAAGLCHGIMQSWFYMLPGGGMVAFANPDEPDSSVVVTVGDLENALAGMAN